MRAERYLLGISFLGGVLLTVIGVRYLLLPEQAARTFGLPAHLAGHELHAIVGLRNVWLGLLAVGFAVLRQWRALALWFALGALVCFADAAIVAGAGGPLPALAFHVGSGLACLALLAAIWRRA
jgi:Domain of unknown function (DUF4267)